MQHANKTRGTGPLGGAGMVGLWGGSSLVESVQQITFTINAATVDTTITAVDTSRSIVMPLSASSQSGSDFIYVASNGGLAFTSSTNVRCYRAGWASGTPDLSAATVIQFRPGVLRSIQAATISNSSSSTTATINAVDTNKTFLIVGQARNVGPGYKTCAKVVLTNSTTITATLDTYDSTISPVSYIQAVEFF